MDQLSNIEVMIGVMKQQARREPYCFDKCMDRFESSITSDQHDCMSNFDRNRRNVHQEVLRGKQTAQMKERTYGSTDFYILDYIGLVLCLRGLA